MLLLVFCLFASVGVGDPFGPCYLQHCVLNGAFCLTISGVCWKQEGGRQQGQGRASHYPMAALLFPLFLPIYTRATLIPCFQPRFIILCFSSGEYISSSIGIWIINRQWFGWLWRARSIISARPSTDRYRINPRGHCLFHSTDLICAHYQSRAWLWRHKSYILVSALFQLRACNIPHKSLLRHSQPIFLR